ncbi:MAG TPA: hypothetical protein VIM98_07735 [Dyella sp.]
MPFSRRLALIVFMVALLIIFGIGFYRAVMHREARPPTAPAPADSAPVRS